MRKSAKPVKRHRIIYIFFALVLILFLTIVLTLFINNQFIGMLDSNRELSSKIPVAVLGDSDSHSYRDSIDNRSRGGKYSAFSFNWLELWTRLADSEIYPGQWGVWGNYNRLSRLKKMLRLKNRSPKKLDYEYNFAVSGLQCQSLLDNGPYQGYRLIDEINANSDYWSNGLVIIKIGINDLGNNKHLLKWIQTGLNQDASDVVFNCTNSIIKTSNLLLSAQPGIKIAIIGVVRNYNFMGEWKEKLNKKEIQNIEQVLTKFDSSLREYALKLPGVAYIDDHYWFNRMFGSREFNNLKSKIEYSGGIKLLNSSGDKPVNMLMSDHHTGTLYNGLFLTHLIKGLNEQLNMTFTLPTLRDVSKISGFN